MAAVALLSLAASGCNEELAPEYKTRPKIENVQYTTDFKGITFVTAKITCPYGLEHAYIVYTVGQSQEPKYSKLQTPVDPETDPTVINFNRTIEAYPEGTKISFYIYAESRYGVRKSSEVYTYVCTAPGEVDPPQVEQ